MKRNRKAIANTPKTGRRSVEWPAFQDRLAETLTLLAEDQFLIINHKLSNRFVQFAAGGNFGLRMETVSNAFLTGTDRINRKQHEALLRLGWGAPTGAASESTPDTDPDGSPNYFIEYPRGESVAIAAEMAVTTLVDVISVSHPGRLEYQAFDTEGNEICVGSLGIQKAKSPSPPETLAQKLLSALISVTGIDDLAFDEDDDIGIVHDELVVFITIIGEPPYVRMYAPVSDAATIDLPLLTMLNHLNCGIDHISYCVRDHVVFAIHDFPAYQLSRELIGSSLQRFIQRVEAVAAELDACADSKNFAATLFHQAYPQ